MKILLYVLVMAGVTYLVRMIPFVVFRKKIKSKLLKDFLYYVPYAVLGAMTIPAVFYSTGNIISASAGFITATVLSIRNKSLLTVAVFACIAAYLAGLAMKFFIASQ